MLEALVEAQKAFDNNEVPIGAVVVNELNEIIGRGYNDRESSQDATRHAEMIAIQEATQRVGSWRLEQCTLYVTLEPCPMCSGAIIQSRIKKVVFGAMDPKGGTVGSIGNLLMDTRFNHNPEIIAGVCKEACGTILTDFFSNIRARKKQSKEFPGK
ncbi:MAG: tRNA adenosine(34) deaminase TadA [Culicoidibacterales bacterium]